MIFDIETHDSMNEPLEGNAVAFVQVQWFADAWDLYHMLEAADLHKNVGIGCYNGYENCVIFNRV